MSVLYCCKACGGAFRPAMVRMDLGICKECSWKKEVGKEAEALVAEIEALNHWRDLALQFDNHRMAALWHLKRLVVDPQSKEVAQLFLSEPPLAAHEVVAERDQLKAEVEALRKDAERYRWLRHHERTENDAELVMRQHGSMLDASIDAVMSKGVMP